MTREQPDRWVLLALAAAIAIAAPSESARAQPRTKPGRVASRETFQSEQAPVHVFVKKALHAGHAVYRYRLVNGSEFPITGLIIGLDYYRGRPQIRMRDDAKPSGRETSPPGWSFHMYPTEEDSVGSIAWEIDEDKSELVGGASLGGFSVEIPSPDAAYENGRWVVYLSRGDQAYYEGALESDVRSPSAPDSSSRRRRLK